MSRFIKFQRFGAPEVLALQEQSVRLPVADEVRVRVDAIGISWDDILWRQNLGMSKARLPAGLGSEMAGVVEALGEGVTDLKVGDKVASFQTDSVNDYPVYGESVLLQRSALTRYPPTLSAREASVHYTPFLAAYFAYVDLARVEAGHTVLITDGLHSPGSAFIQLGKALGARVIGLAKNEEDVALLKELGIEAVCGCDRARLVAEVSELTAGKGVSAVFDGLGGERMAWLGDVLAARGSLVLYGLGGGNSMFFPTEAALRKNIRIFVHCLSNFTGKSELGIAQDRSAVERALVAINMLSADGALALTIEKAFPFEQFCQAHHYMEERAGHGGHVVLEIDRPA